VTRIPRYMWFLKEMVKQTKQEEEASENLLKAYEAMKNVMNYINEYKLQKENNAKLSDIQSALGGYKQKIVVPGRTLIREGLLQKAESDGKKPIPMKFYVFNDLFLWAEEKGPTSYKFKDSVPIHQLLVKDITDLKYAFQVKRLDKKKVYTIFCKSEPEKNLWVGDLKKIIDEVSLKQDKSAQLAKALQLQEFMKEQTKL